MKTVDWALSSNVYEVNIRQYTPAGDFSSFAKHLPRLQKMGIEILWLMPITPISHKGRKGTLGSYYACSSYTGINVEFGNIDDFKALVNYAHDLGFKVVIDWVANHTGQDHEWTFQHPEFYKKNEQGNFYDAHGWNDVIDLNYSYKPLWAAMLSAMSFWLEHCDIDGFRCDMAHLVPLDFWQYVRSNLDLRKKLLWIAETEDPHYHMVFDATYGWELLHGMEKLFRKELQLLQIKDLLLRYSTRFPQDALRLLFTSNHDENSHSGSEWERLGKSATPFAVLCATWQNSLPLIYSGQEIPNTKRLLFFDKDEIKWTGNYQLEHFYTTLLTLRKNNPSLHACNDNNKSILINNSAHESILSYHRKNHTDEILVVLNLSHENVNFELFDFHIEKSMKDIFSQELFSSNTLHLNAWDFKIFSSHNTN